MNNKTQDPRERKTLPRRGWWWYSSEEGRREGRGKSCGCFFFSGPRAFLFRNDRACSGRLPGLIRCGSTATYLSLVLWGRWILTFLIELGKDLTRDKRDYGRVHWWTTSRSGSQHYLPEADWPRRLSITFHQQRSRIKISLRRRSCDGLIRNRC